MSEETIPDISPFGFSRQEVKEHVDKIMESGIMFGSFLTTNNCGYFECIIDGDIHMTFEILALTGKK